MLERNASLADVLAPLHEAVRAAERWLDECIEDADHFESAEDISAVIEETHSFMVSVEAAYSNFERLHQYTLDI